MLNPKITLIELSRSIVEAAAKKEDVGFNPMQKALSAAYNKKDPVFVKRGQSILVMERYQFLELKQALEGE